MSGIPLPSKKDTLEQKIRQLDARYRAQLKAHSDENQRLMELNDSLWHHVVFLRRENRQLRERLSLPERRYEALAPSILRSSSLEFEPERTLRF